MGLGVGGHAGLLRRRRRPPGRLRAARAAHRGPAARRAGLRDPTLQRRRALHLGGLLLPLRVHLPDHPVLPVRQGLLDAVGRRAHAALCRSSRPSSPRSRPSWRSGRVPARRDGRAAAHGGRSARGGLQLGGRHRATSGRSSSPWCCWPSGSPPSRRPRRRRSWARWPTTSEAPPPASTTRPGSSVAPWAWPCSARSSPRPTPPGSSAPSARCPSRRAPRPRRTSPWRRPWPSWPTPRHAVRPALESIAFTAFHSGLRGGLHRRRRGRRAGRAGRLQAPARAAVAATSDEAMGEPCRGARAGRGLRPLQARARSPREDEPPSWSANYKPISL